MGLIALLCLLAGRASAEAESAPAAPRDELADAGPLLRAPGPLTPEGRIVGVGLLAAGGGLGGAAVGAVLGGAATVVGYDVFLCPDNGGCVVPSELTIVGAAVLGAMAGTFFGALSGAAFGILFLPPATSVE